MACLQMSMAAYFIDGQLLRSHDVAYLRESLQSRPLLEIEEFQLKGCNFPLPLDDQCLHLRDRSRPGGLHPASRNFVPVHAFRSSLESLARGRMKAIERILTP